MSAAPLVADVLLLVVVLILHIVSLIPGHWMSNSLTGKLKGQYATCQSKSKFVNCMRVELAEPEETSG